MSDDPLKRGRFTDIAQNVPIEQRAALIAKGVPTDAETAFAALSPVGSAEAHMSMTVKQQIRAKALECAVKFVCAMPVEEVLKAKVAEPLLWHNCAEFERYIREGK